MKMARVQVPFIATVLCGVFCYTAFGINTTYIVALLGQDLQIGQFNQDIEYELVIVNTEPTSITVEIKGITGLLTNITVDMNSTKIYSLNHTMGMNGSEFSNKSLIIHSEGGMFVLEVFTKRNNHIEGLLAIPVQRMNGQRQHDGVIVYDHVAATFCAVGGYCQIAIAAAQNDTEIFIQIPDSVEEIALCNKSSYFRSKRDTRITMNQFEALQLETTYDLTGTVVYSFQPIAVFAGSRNVTYGNNIAHMMEQLVPTSHWGKEFIVQNLGDNGYGDILKIVSHFTNTTVTMKGFPSFNVHDRYHTVTRRLDKGFRSHIQASHPIQVIQITGLSYVTTNEISALSMTVVPSVQNAWKQFAVSCPSSTSAAQFHLVTEKDVCENTVAAGKPYTKCRTPTSESRIKYTKYMIGTIDINVTTEDVLKITNNDATISGILKCGQTAVMPVGIFYNENVTGTIPERIPVFVGGTCYEGGKASTFFFHEQSSLVPYIIELNDYYQHVFKLRVRVCGSAVLKFMNNNESVDVILSYKGMRISSCTPSCSYPSSSSSNSVSNSFNEEAGVDCTSDMSLFWFWHTGSSFCLGTGYNHKKAECEDGSTGDIIRILTEPFDRVSVIGTFADASFNWDFIHVDGCKDYEFGWRCADRLLNCSLYEHGFCANQKYNEFSAFYCAKFCGKCFADSYGRKFMVKTPYATSFTSCWIVVSPLNEQTNVALTLKNTRSNAENVRHGTRYDNGERHYNCTDSLSILDSYTIWSDDDVTVVVLLQFGDEIKSAHIYPVDSFGTEFMALEHSDTSKNCRFLSEYDGVEHVSYYSISVKNNNKNKDAERVSLTFDLKLRTTTLNDMTGTLFVFNKPSTVFCADLFSKRSAKNHFNQLLATNTWSAEYVVPAFGGAAVSRPFEGKLLIVSDADNTIVNISGGFDAIHAAYNRGDKIEQEIDLGSTYRIQASEKIGVGLHLYDPEDPSKSSFNLLTPVQNFHDTILTSIPNKVLDNMGFGVTDIKTYFVDRQLSSTMISKDNDDIDPFYRHVSLDDVKFEMTVVEYGTEKWFVVPGNIRNTVNLTPAKAICKISTALKNDGRDNDCDGLADEESYYVNKYGVYKQDSDLDGDFGDDFGGDLVSSPVLVTIPEEPVCFEIKQVPGQCWKACTCSCSMAEKIKKYKNMTKEQMIEAEQSAIEQNKRVLQLDTEKLTIVKARRNSIKDKRQSAASIGYVSIGVFAAIFGTIFIMDLGALKRDALILMSNLKDGFESLYDCTLGRFCKKRRQPGETESVE